MNQYGEKELTEFTCFSEEEYKRIEEALKSVPFGAVFSLCLYGGMPLRHALAVTEDGLDFEKKTVTIRKEVRIKKTDNVMYCRRNDTIYLMTGKTEAILRKSLEVRTERMQSEEYNKNNPSGLIFALPSGELPTGGQIAYAEEKLQRKSLCPAATPTRMMQSCRYMHCWDAAESEKK